jgi:hypothetical protein
MYKFIAAFLYFIVVIILLFSGTLTTMVGMSYFLLIDAEQHWTIMDNYPNANKGLFASLIIISGIVSALSLIIFWIINQSKKQSNAKS